MNASSCPQVTAVILHEVNFVLGEDSIQAPWGCVSKKRRISSPYVFDNFPFLAATVARDVAN
jgi:hypothetical protein